MNGGENQQDEIGGTSHTPIAQPNPEVEVVDETKYVINTMNNTRQQHRFGVTFVNNNMIPNQF